MLFPSLLRQYRPPKNCSSSSSSLRETLGQQLRNTVERANGQRPSPHVKRFTAIYTKLVLKQITTTEFHGHADGQDKRLTQTIDSTLRWYVAEYSNNGIYSCSFSLFGIFDGFIEQQNVKQLAFF